MHSETCRSRFSDRRVARIEVNRAPSPPAVKFAKLFRQVVVAERSVIFPETEGLAAKHGVHDEAQDARRPGAAGGISALRLPGAAARCWYLAKVLR